MEKEEYIRNHQQCRVVFPEMTFSSEFDSGNLSNVIQNSPNSVILFSMIYLYPKMLLSSQKAIHTLYGFIFILLM